jgi:hypothetical protein
MFHWMQFKHYFMKFGSSRNEWTPYWSKCIKNIRWSWNANYSSLTIWIYHCHEMRNS